MVALNSYCANYQGPVVQRWVSANPGLKFTPIDPEKISEEIFPNL